MLIIAPILDFVKLPIRRALPLPFPLAILLIMRLLHVIGKRLESFNLDPLEMPKYASS
jgi:hypothetical protein